MTGHRQWLTAGDPVSGLTVVAIAACTVSDMTLRNTFRIGATLQMGADILAFGYTVCLGASSMRGTIVMSLALNGATTALVIRITDETRRTDAFIGTARVATPSTGTARRILAEVDDVTAYTRISTKARLTVASLSMILGSAESILPTRLGNQTGNLAHVIVTGLVI